MELQNFAQDWISNFGVYNWIVDLIWKSDYTCSIWIVFVEDFIQSLLYSESNDI